MTPESISIEKKSEQYTASNIELLGELEGIRKRPGMYIGPTNATGLHHLVWEIVDNAVDEAVNGYGDKVMVTIHKDGSVSVEDEGRGIPVDWHEKSKMPAVQLIFSTLHSGGKFNNKAYVTAAGLHGVGATVTNALSEWIDITIFRQGKIHHIRFENGGKLAVPLEEIGTTRKHGSLIRFKPDATIFSTVEFKWDTIYNHLREAAFLLRKVHFILKDERSGLSHEFYYEEGLKAYVEALTENKEKIGDIMHFEDTNSDIKCELALCWCAKDYNETILSYANSVRCCAICEHDTIRSQIILSDPGIFRHGTCVRKMIPGITKLEPTSLHSSAVRKIILFTLDRLETGNHVPATVEPVPRAADLFPGRCWIRTVGALVPPAS